MIIVHMDLISFNPMQQVFLLSSIQRQEDESFARLRHLPKINIWGVRGAKTKAQEVSLQSPCSQLPCLCFLFFFLSPFSSLTSVPIGHIILNLFTFYFITYCYEQVLITASITSVSAISSPIICCLDYCSILCTGVKAFRPCLILVTPPYFSLGNVGLIVLFCCSKNPNGSSLPTKTNYNLASKCSMSDSSLFFLCSS